MARIGVGKGEPARPLTTTQLLLWLPSFLCNHSIMASSFAGPVPKPRQTEDEVLATFDSVPLFMKSLPEDDSQDSTLAALQSLIYEGTPDGKWDIFPINLLWPQVEIAQNFKEQGNDYFKGKRFREALGFYTQGLDAKPTDPAILEAILCNRAACNLELGEYLAFYSTVAILNNGSWKKIMDRFWEIAPKRSLLIPNLRKRTTVQLQLSCRLDVLKKLSIAAIDVLPMIPIILGLRSFENEPGP